MSAGYCFISLWALSSLPSRAAFQILRPLEDDAERLGATDRAREAVDGAAFRWTGLTSRASGWPSDASSSQWRGLLSALRPSLARHRPSVLSLRAVAAALLCAGPLAEALGLTRWPQHADPDEVGELAYDLVCLGDARNQLAHRVAGRAEDAAAVRTRALRVGARVLTSVNFRWPPPVFLFRVM